MYQIKNDLTKTITDILMFEESFNVKMRGEPLKIHNPYFTFIHGVEHTVYLFFNYFHKMPILNHNITSHKAIYKLFGSVV